jgi:hypothetical protein
MYCNHVLAFLVGPGLGFVQRLFFEQSPNDKVTSPVLFTPSKSIASFLPNVDTISHIWMFANIMQCISGFWLGRCIWSG